MKKIYLKQGTDFYLTLFFIKYYLSTYLPWEFRTNQQNKSDKQCSFTQMILESGTHSCPMRQWRCHPIVGDRSSTNPDSTQSLKWKRNVDFR